MKFTSATILAVAATSAQAFTSPSAWGVGKIQQKTSETSLFNVRPKTEKSQELRFGWDGSTALGT
jgi:hypothetical protein